MEDGQRSYSIDQHINWVDGFGWLFIAFLTYGNSVINEAGLGTNIVLNVPESI
jgi:hypothetical protein